MAVLESELITPKKRTVRQYSDVERLNALALYDSTGSVEQASKALNIPTSTILTWSNYCDRLAPARASKANELAAKFEFAADKFLRLALKKARKASFHHLMTGAGIAVDKMQLLRGEPTSIPGMSEAERQLRLGELLSRLQERGQVAKSVSDGGGMVADG